MDKFLWTIMGIAIGATASGLLGNFAYGLVIGGVVGAGIDLYRYFKHKDEKEMHIIEPEDDDEPQKSMNSAMRNTREVMNKPSEEEKKDEK